MDYAVLTPMQAQNFGQEAPELAAEMCRALNDWTREEWLDRGARACSARSARRTSTPISPCAEIERLAGDERFVQVLLPGTMEQGLGNRRYWPILRAAAEAGLPVALHTGGNEMHTGAGWPSYYLEMHVWNGNTMAMQMLSMICGGAFEEIPGLQMVSVETGIAWAAALSGRWTTRGARSARATRRGCSEPPSRATCASTGGSRRSRSRSPTTPSTSRWPSTRSAWSTGSCSPPTTRTGTSTPRRRRCRGRISKEDKAKIFAGNACRLYGPAAIR